MICISECSSIEWPIIAYGTRVPPFRLLVYRHHTWVTPPILALNLSFTADTPTSNLAFVIFFSNVLRENTLFNVYKSDISDIINPSMPNVHVTKNLY